MFDPKDSNYHSTIELELLLVLTKKQWVRGSNQTYRRRVMILGITLNLRRVSEMKLRKFLLWETRKEISPRLQTTNFYIHTKPSLSIIFILYTLLGKGPFIASLLAES
jgi:hypothetical protein